MPAEAQLPEPAATLLDAARRAVPVWLRRAIEDACRRGGVDPAPLRVELDATIDRSSADALDGLAELLAADVDRQWTTPLAMLRDAAAARPAAFLRAHGVAPSAPSAPSGHGRAGDGYELGPANWADVDPSLHEPGLRWGAWKAMTILARRRDDGLR